MNWVLLYSAIFFEVAGTTSLKLSAGMQRMGFFLLALAFYGISLGLFTISLKTLPVGIAYAMWAGVGTVLVAIIGFIWFKEPATALRMLFIAMIIVGAVGLNLVGSRPTLEP